MFISEKISKFLDQEKMAKKALNDITKGKEKEKIKKKYGRNDEKFFNWKGKKRHKRRKNK